MTGRVSASVPGVSCSVSDAVRAIAASQVPVISAVGHEIDTTLAGAAENWDLERMAIIDRNILRIAVAELLHVDDVPWKVAIDEAVTLASRYGGADSPRFVNGVLDALAHKLNLIAS